jgi:hypothetical protein
MEGGHTIFSTELGFEPGTSVFNSNALVTVGSGHGGNVSVAIVAGDDGVVLTTGTTDFVGSALQNTMGNDELDDLGELLACDMGSDGSASHGSGIGNNMSSLTSSSPSIVGLPDNSTVYLEDEDLSEPVGFKDGKFPKARQIYSITINPRRNCILNLEHIRRTLDDELDIIHYFATQLPTFNYGKIIQWDHIGSNWCSSWPRLQFMRTLRRSLLPGSSTIVFVYLANRTLSPHIVNNVIM